MAGQRRVLDAPLRIRQLRAEAELRMHKHGVLAVALIEAPRGVAQEHHGELKPLRFMYRHYLHRRRVCRARRRLLSLFGQTTQPQHEAVQSAVSAALKALRQLHKLQQIRAALLAVRHGAAYREHVQLVAEPPCQLRRAHIRRFRAEFGERPDKVCAFLVSLRRGAQRRIEVAALPGSPYGGQLVRREPEHR